MLCPGNAGDGPWKSVGWENRWKKRIQPGPQVLARLLFTRKIKKVLFKEIGCVCFLVKYFWMGNGVCCTPAPSGSCTPQPMTIWWYVNHCRHIPLACACAMVKTPKGLDTTSGVDESKWLSWHFFKRWKTHSNFLSRIILQVCWICELKLTKVSWMALSFLIDFSIIKASYYLSYPPIYHNLSIKWHVGPLHVIYVCFCLNYRVLFIIAMCFACSLMLCQRNGWFLDAFHVLPVGWAAQFIEILVHQTPEKILAPRWFKAERHKRFLVNLAFLIAAESRLEARWTHTKVWKCGFRVSEACFLMLFLSFR